MSWDSPDSAWEALAEQTRAAEALRPIPTDALAAALHDGGRGVLVVKRGGQVENARTWGTRKPGGEGL